MKTKNFIRYHPHINSQTEKSAELIKLAKLVAEDVRKIFESDRPKNQSENTKSTKIEK